MDARQTEIVQAAWAMFARYGYAKTTMSDIARHAGVARQTVYNAFESKEDILRAVVRLAGEQSLAAVLAAWVDEGSLERKIAAFQELGPLSWYEAMLSTPDWAEVMDGLHKEAVRELAGMETQWRRELVGMLREAQVPGGRDAASLEDIAEFLYATSKNAKYGAEDAAHMKRRLATIRAATLALLGAD